MGYSFGYQGNLPAEVVAVLHGDVHSLPGLGAVGVHGIPRQEDALVGIEIFAHSLSDLNRACQRQAVSKYERRDHIPDTQSTSRNTRSQS